MQGPFFPCRKPHTPLLKKVTISDDDFNGSCDHNHGEKSKRNRTARSFFGCPFKFGTSHITSKDKCIKKISENYFFQYWTQSYAEQTDADQSQDGSTSTLSPPKHVKQ